MPGDLLVVHASFRALRPVEDGPAGLIQSLQRAVTPRGGLLMPSWPEDATAPFDPRATPTSADLGIVAETFRSLPDVERADHAASFAAWGAHTASLLRDPMPLPPHRLESPVGRAWEHDAKVLLLGVGHDANTTIHLAEVLAGVPYGIEHRCRIRDADGERVISYVENDHCCEKFGMVDGWLDAAGLQRMGTVGSATARLANARDVVRVVRSELECDPLVFLHEPGVCSECDLARSHIRAGSRTAS